MKCIICTRDTSEYTTFLNENEVIVFHDSKELLKTPVDGWRSAAYDGTHLFYTKEGCGSIFMRSMSDEEQVEMQRAKIICELLVLIVEDHILAVSGNEQQSVVTSKHLQN